MFTRSDVKGAFKQMRKDIKKGAKYGKRAFRETKSAVKATTRVGGKAVKRVDSLMSRIWK